MTYPSDPVEICGSGPLAPLFAQVREARAWIEDAVLNAPEDSQTYAAAKELLPQFDAALSAIERHVREMETALGVARTYYEHEQAEPAREGDWSEWREWEQRLYGLEEELADALAALPAREKGTECPAGHGSQCCGYPGECREAMEEAR